MDGYHTVRYGNDGRKHVTMKRESRMEWRLHVTNWEVAMLVSAWRDLDRAVEDVSMADMLRQYAGGSSFAWTVAHVTHGVDSWINGRFQGHPPQPLIAKPRFRMGGDGRAGRLVAIQAAVADVRERAHAFLADLAPAELDRVVPYDGAYLPFRERGIHLRTAIVQNALHHTFHLGEIVAKRELLGYSTADFPGPVTAAIQGCEPG